MNTPEYFESCDYNQIIEEESVTGDHLTHCIKQVFGPYLRIIDVGCGPGVYVQKMNDGGLYVKGIDVDPRTQGKPNIICADFMSDEVNFVNAADLAISFEVAEHLPESLAKDFIYKLTLIADTVLFSAAQVGQSGTNHINCQSKEYWADIFLKYGFTKDIEKENQFIQLLQSGFHMIWMTNNVQIFNHNL